MRIIGITGTLGAGKGTIVDYLTEHHDYKHYSVRAYLTARILESDLPLNRDSMVQTANALRAENGPDFIIRELYSQALKTGENAIIESIRTPGEIDALLGLEGFLLLAVDAEVPLRYKRVTQRNSETDQLDYLTFISNEKREMRSTDPNKQNISACMRRADFLIDNNGDFDALYKQVDSALQKISTYA